MNTIGQDDAEIPSPVAIESDGTERYRRMSVRERSRLRPQLLERMGWRYMPLWTIEVFTDPSACADRIGGYLGLEKPVAASRLRSSPGFSDDIENLSVEDGRHSYGGSAAAPQGWSAGGDRGQETAIGNKEAGGMNADGDNQNNNTRGGDRDQSVPEATSPEVPAREAVPADMRQRPAAGGVLPNKAAEDDPRRWGDQPGSYDHDAWLQEQKPPHWG
jgi:hypothetical protein